MRRTTLAAAATILAGCLGPGDSRSSFTLDFDLNVLGQGWTPAAADFPTTQSGAVGIVGDQRTLPAPLTATQKALYLSGTNVTGDLFLFHSKYYPGLTPLATYSVSLQVEYATNYHAGCSTGAGPLTVIKAGVTSAPPLVEADGQGVLRVAAEKGTGTNPGQYTQLGDIRNGLAGCPSSGTFAIRSTPLRKQTAPVVTDAQGGFYIFLATQSSFIGSQQIFLTRVKLVFEN